MILFHLIYKSITKVKKDQKVDFFLMYERLKFIFRNDRATYLKAQYVVDMVKDLKTEIEDEHNPNHLLKCPIKPSILSLLCYASQSVER